MATFYYKAVSPGGELSSGTLSAEHQQEAIEKIRAMGRIPIKADEEKHGFLQRLALRKRNKSANKKLGSKLESFSLQMASLLDAGIPVDESLRIIQDTGGDLEISQFAADMDAGLRGGQNLAEVAASSNNDIPPICLSILRTSEASGDMGRGFESLADFLKRARESRERLKSAMIYPLILTIVSLLSLVTIFTFVIPQFSELFADMGQALPLLTRMVLAIAAFLSDWGLVLLTMVFVSIWFARQRMRDERVRARLDRRIVHIPQLGNFVLRYQTERYCRSLAVLLDSGMTLTQAMAIARESITNRFLEQAARKAEARVGEGVNIASALASSGPWPALSIQLLQVGERTGDLTKMLRKIADTFENEVTILTNRFLSILEPLLVVFLGMVIAIIIISVLMGIMSVNDLPI